MPTPSLDNRRSSLRAVWPLLLIMALMLGASVASVLVVSWTRAAEHGLALWGIAEHQAVHELHRYAETGEAIYYERFQRELAVPAAFETARLQLKHADPDHGLVQENLRAAGIAENDIPRIVHLFRTFGHFPPVVRALDLWTMGNALALELAPVGTRMHAEFQRGADPQRVRELRDRAAGIHARIRPLLRE